MLLLGDIRRLRNPRDAFARSAATTGRDTLSTLRAFSLPPSIARFHPSVHRLFPVAPALATLFPLPVSRFLDK